MKLKYNVNNKVSLFRKVVVLVIAIAMVMLMNQKVFAITDVDASMNVYNLHRYSSYAAADTTGNDSGWFCAVTVTAFNNSVGNSDMSYGYAYAGTSKNAPSNHCTYSTSTHNASKNGIHYQRNLKE